VGFPRKRLGKDGKPRYTAYYVDVKGKERSAGTYATKGESNHAWPTPHPCASSRLGAYPLPIDYRASPATPPPCSPVQRSR
jgi:hypothetical protein